MTTQGAGGYYLVTATAFFAASATAQRRLYFQKNGVTAVCGLAVAPSSAAAANGISNTCLITLAASDYIEVLVFQDSGGNLNVGTNGGVGIGGASYAAMTKLW